MRIKRFNENFFSDSNGRDLHVNAETGESWYEEPEKRELQKKESTFEDKKRMLEDNEDIDMVYHWIKNGEITPEEFKELIELNYI
jgi:hypothetical protein